MTEIWKDVEGYEGLYEVSNLGRIRSLDRITTQLNNGSLSAARYKGKILKGRQTRGYITVHVSKDGKPEPLLVHRVVATAFCIKPDGCDIVNHLDNNPSNNRADNLEWTTYKGNMQWATKQGRMHYNPDNLKKAQEAHNVAVIAITPSGERMYFKSQAEAGRILNIHSGHIAAACRKDYGYKTVGGYEWEYADEERQKKCKSKKIRS